MTNWQDNPKIGTAVAALTAAIHAAVRHLNRRGNPKYAALAERRIHSDAPLLADVSTHDEPHDK